MGAAFAYTLGEVRNFGSNKVAYGTYTSTGTASGGDINTGLGDVVFMTIQPKHTDTITTNVGCVTTALPAPGDVIAIKTDADEVGYWMAIGW